ncbi:uncharacterized protein LAESUDRAFT_763686 [Laetiporus sulphureus 93-53]|uniref:Uncharacterized protein n=1 Tax=Laetiporus sulphureus 93-53 TaxID=1314785 RepID=A0A165BSA8_9APHY|nr:uncharacterized protein LAESUDRAFT_763686 [Laetiporus sulphureus 93-53]KZT01562.1 hypothetical protein LAESUDRAFT_763686 [Laetiporus sulphureus 93-53]
MHVISVHFTGKDEGVEQYEVELFRTFSKQVHYGDAKTPHEFAPVIFQSLVAMIEWPGWLTDSVEALKAVLYKDGSISHWAPTEFHPQPQQDLDNGWEVIPDTTIPVYDHVMLESLHMPAIHDIWLLVLDWVEVTTSLTWSTLWGNFILADFFFTSLDIHSTIGAMLSLLQAHLHFEEVINAILAGTLTHEKVQIQVASQLLTFIANCTVVDRHDLSFLGFTCPLLVG